MKVWIQLMNVLKFNETNVINEKNLFLLKTSSRLDDLNHKCVISTTHL